jgi:GH18 family chitinase
MKTTLLILLFILHYGSLRAQSKAQTNLVFITYYPSWCQNALGTSYQDKSMGLPPEDVDWTRINIVVHFGGAYPTTTSPYTNITYDPATGLANTQKGIEYEYGNDIWNPGSGSNCGYDHTPPSPCPNWRHWQADLISTAHAHGVKVLFDIEAIGLNEHHTMYNLTLDASKTAVFANYTAGYINLRGYDGVEIDWEFFTDWSRTPSQEQITRLTAAFRKALGPDKILVYAPVFTNYNIYPAALDSMVDFYALQCYAYVSPWYKAVNSNSVWHDSPLHKGTVPAGFEGEAWDSRGPLDWVAGGHDPKKIVPGAYSGAYVYHNVDGLFQATGWTPAGEGDHKHADRLPKNGGRKIWDDARQVPYISGTALRTEGNTWYGAPGVSAGQRFFAVYEDSQSIKAKVDWVRANGLGGLMLYNFSSDIVDLRYGENPVLGKTNPVHAWVAAALGVAPPPKRDTVPPVITDVAITKTTHSSAAIAWKTNEAANSQVEYGTTSRYGRTTAIDPYLVTSHLATVNDLTPTTVYHFRVKSRDIAGNVRVSTDYSFRTAAPPLPSSVRSDDFNTPSVNTSIWTFINPFGDASLRIIHENKENGLLCIKVPAGRPHDVWTKGNNAPRIMQSANDTDFEVELKFESEVTTRYQIQGLIIEEDTQNYLRLDFHSDGSATRLFAASFVNGTPTPRANRVIAANGVVPLYMKLKRQGTLWTHSYSFDGKTWTVADSFSHALKVTKVGTFISNEGNPPPAFTGLLDYFLNTGSPSASSTNRTE